MLSCNEELPPRGDPNNVVACGSDLTYNFGITSNEMRIELNVANTHDETLEDKASLTGYLIVQLVRDRSFSKRLNFTVGNAQSPPNYNSGTHVLRIDPKAKIIFQQTWDLVDDLGRDLKVDAFHYINDPGCTNRKISRPEIFVVEGKFTVFDKLGEIEIPQSSYQFCYVNFWANPSACPPITPASACSYLNQ